MRYREDEVVEAPIPKLDELGKWNGKEKEFVLTTKSEYFDLILELLKQAGKTFTLLDAFNAVGVCAAGFSNAFTALMVRLESAAAVYHVLPRGGGVYDEPAYVIESFETIRKARDDYYLYKRKDKNHD